MALLSQRAYARHRAERGLSGTTHRAVQKAIEGGRIPLVDGKIDPDLADAAWEAGTSAGHRRNADEEEQGRAKVKGAPVPAPAPPAGDAPTAGGLSLAQASAVEKAYRARLARLDWEERNGSLVPVAEVKAEWFRLVAEARNKVLGIPSKARARIPELSAAGVAALDDLVREALEALAEEPAREVVA